MYQPVLVCRAPDNTFGKGFSWKMLLGCKWSKDVAKFKKILFRKSKKQNT